MGGTNHFYKLFVDVIKYTPLVYDPFFDSRALRAERRIGAGPSP